jgi:cell division protein FtsW (lipid II flippase)
MRELDQSDAPHSSSIANREIVRVEYNLTGKAPATALISFVLAFLIVAAALFFDRTDYDWRFDFFVAAPCIVGCLSCSLIFMRLLLGTFDPAMNWSLMAAAAFACYGAGEKCHVVVLLTAMAYVSMLLTVHFVIGISAPIVRVTRQPSRNVR